MDKLGLAEFELGPSWHLALLLMAAHAATILLLATLPLAAALQVAGSLLLAGHCARVVRRHALRRGSGVPCALGFANREDVVLRFSRGEPLSGRLQGGSTVSNWLVVLNISLARGRTLPVVLMRDSLAPGEFRRLLVWLRWGPAARPDQP